MIWISNTVGKKMKNDVGFFYFWTYNDDPQKWRVCTINLIS